MDAVIQGQMKGWHSTAAAADRTPLVIGAGLPRTGTSSTFEALNTLGFGAVMHMAVNFQQPWRIDTWRKALLAKRLSLNQGELKLKPHYHPGPAEMPDWSVFLSGYGATLDSPACEFVPEFLEAFPDAKVVLTVRDSDEAWWQSYMGTVGKIGEAFGFHRQKVALIPRLYNQACLAEEIAEYWRQKYCSDLEQQNSAIVHSRHNAYIKEIVPADRLLIFNVKEGWQPLCDFLGVPVPKTPFPHVNDTHGVNKIITTMQRLGLAMWALSLGGGTALAIFAAKLVIRHGGLVASWHKLAAQGGRLLGRK
ncbi:P-loop containing nucleoside triphosphate hydrolase protein [Protomyces lactucae-debilis]|uniref:p-loop containing nucleoside triphosphate hydrolase protein n=1 Tax=Protomyces lactucae-debilis TaxID=2754530 RepID=A0A1Y2FAR1_PROLT|nr:P-loop containing nucleoside triphosphate hydrolase protein [Protomyces lactucae-debilis]ORY80998.1 P-loop containing nucleoside triphosphate hydrolase protein [Protomyces lactucae-debilis]